MPEHLRGIGVLDEVHQHVLNEANEVGKVYTNRDEVAKAVSVSSPQAYRALRRLAEEGVLTIEWGNKGRRTIVSLVATSAQAVQS